MRCSDRALCDLVSINLRQTPVIILSLARSIASMQSAQVRESPQQSRNRA
jgi:hypothetical protein